MEVLFENTYVHDEEWAKDIYKYMYFYSPIRLFIFIIVCINFGIGLYNLILGDSFGLFLVLLMFVWMGLNFYSYKKSVKMALNRDIEMCGKPAEIIVVVTDENIKQHHSAGAETQLIYSEIKKVVQTEKYIYLCSKTNLLYTLKKDGFFVGTSEGFLMFLKNKGFKIK